MSKMLEKKRQRKKKLRIKSILRIQMSNIQNITKQIKFEKNNNKIFTRDVNVFTLDRNAI